MGRPPKRTRRPRPVMPPAEQACLDAFFQTGVWPADAPADLRCADDSRHRRLWLASRERLVASQITAHPGTRPFAWWAWDTAEPRRRLGGTGDACHDVLAYTPWFRFGLPVVFVSERLRSVLSADFRGTPVDPQDPPVFESQAAFLDRHGLFAPGERDRVPADAWTPETRSAAVDDRDPATGRPFDPTTTYAMHVTLTARAREQTG
jgi:hypothetical protein